MDEDNKVSNKWDDKDDLETSGVEDLEDWISQLNEDDVYDDEEFACELDTFYAEDLKDSEIHINFNTSVDKMQQTDNYQPLEMEFHQNPGAMAQFSQYPYAYGALGTYSLTQQPPGSPQSASAYGPLSLSSQPPSQRLSSNQLKELTEAIELCKRENMQDKECDDEVPSPKSHAVLLSYKVSFELRSIINILKGMSNNELHSVLQSLKFEHVLDLFDCISHLYKKDLEIELCQTCAKILTNFNLERLLSSKQHHQILIDLKDLLFGSKMPLIIKPGNDIDIGSSSETSSIKEPRMRYSGWKWVENKDQTKKLSDSVKVDVNSYFPVLSSSSTLDDESCVLQKMHVTEEHHNLIDADDKEESIVCCSCFYEKKPDDGVNFIMVQCGHLYCKPCTNFIFSTRNQVKPHKCFICEAIIKRVHNQNVI